MKRKITLRIDNLFAKTPLPPPLCAPPPRRRVSFDDLYYNAKHSLPPPKNEQMQSTAASHKNTKSLACIHNELSGVVGSMDHSKHEHIRETECFLSREEVREVMRKLGLMRDREQLDEVWGELQGDTYGGIPSENLLALVMCILDSTITPTTPITNHSHSKNISLDSNLKISMNGTQRRAIFNKYSRLRHNREQRKALRGKENRVENKSLPKPKHKSISIYQHNTSTTPHQTIKQDISNTIITPSLSTLTAPLSNLISPSLIAKEGDSLCDIVASIRIKKPILSVDVNLGENRTEKIIVYEGESALEVSERLVANYNIDEKMRSRFESMLHQHLKNILWKIEEVEEEMITDR